MPHRHVSIKDNDNLQERGEIIMKNLKKLGNNCIECGSAAISSTVDEVKPIFKIEIINFACGAVLKSTYTSNGMIGKAVHSGCSGF
jgi:hypothetical protein